MKILHVLSQVELTGAEVYAQNLVSSQVQNQHEVFVVSDRIHVELPTPWIPLSVSTSSRFRRFKNILALRKILKEQRIQVIHCHSRAAVRHAYWARWGLPIAMVTTLHGRQHFSWSKRLLDIYGEIRIGICENVKKAMAMDFLLPDSSIRVLRNPVANVPHAKSEKSRMGLKLALIGRSSGPKGERFEKIALSCFSDWLQTDPSLELFLIAPQPERFSQALHELMKDLEQRFPGRVRLLGQIRNLREHLAEFDLVLGSGRIAVESLLEEVPVFAIGEHSAPGLVTTENLSECLASNFGDIGAVEVEAPLDLNQIRQSVPRALKSRNQPSPELRPLKERILHEFDPVRINREVLDIYRAALFKRHVPRWTPLLMYHKIPNEPLPSRHRIFVTRENFRKQLRFFRLRGFQTLTFHDLWSFWSGDKSYSDFPKRPLLLTFDDGYVDNLTNAQPLLKEFGFRAVIYLLGNHQILENTWDADTGEKPEPLMSLEQKRRLDPAVWEIGSHGFDHLHLTQVPPEAAFEEMQKSRLQLQQDLGRDVLSFAYPFGSTSAAIAELAEKAGYRFAVNTDQGGLHLADQPFSLFRVNVFPEDGFWQLWKKTSTWYRKYFYRKRNR